MVKVLFDYQIFHCQMYGGISRYFSQLMKQFDEKKLLDFKLSLIFSENCYLKNVKFSKHINILKGKKFRYKDKVLDIFRKINRWKSIKDLKFNDFDIFHPTYYDTYFLDYLKNKPFVITIYDMIYDIYAGEYFPENISLFEIERKKKLAKSCTKIIAISENTKKDLIKFYKIDENKIDVIHLANSLNPNRFKKVKIPEKFILFVGDRAGYKNFIFFLEAIIPLLRKDNNLKLVCCGARGFSIREKRFLKENNLEKNVLFYFVDDEELTFLYKKALVFVFPSLYEGFGLPVIEAFSIGCPVVLSNRGSLPEIAEGAAVYFDPTNLDSIRHFVEKVIYDKDLKKDLIGKGYEQAKKFSWEKTAYRTKKVYESVL